MSKRDYETLTTDCSYDEVAKKAFHRVARKHLTRVAKALGRAKGEYRLSSNMGGAAVSGEVTLKTKFIHIEVSQFGGGLPPVRIRTCQGMDDHTGGRNHFYDAAELIEVDDLLVDIESVLGRPLRKAPKLAKRSLQAA